MSEKSLFCLGWHFKNLYEQGINNKPFDFATPCETCERFSECGGEWLDMVKELKSYTGIEINTMIQSP
ncbi:MAG: hypothetical protein NC122_06125 [Faecalibacterium sp.]|nr:hypothetical protein [Ruminococcus sp.]MCM1393229.1 hypothetical protein [Ruminococcus sp.]MCM1485767.1 hypothetical protein [Faecalibacterium sp.]